MYRTNGNLFSIPPWDVQNSTTKVSIKSRSLSITSKREGERARKGASLGQFHAPCSFSFRKCFTFSRSQRTKIRPLANTGRANAHSAVQALTNVVGSCCMHGATAIPDDHVILVQPAVSYMDVVVGDQHVVSYNQTQSKTVGRGTTRSCS